MDEETGVTKVKDMQKVVVGGMLTGKTIKYTKTNQVMAFITLEDLVGTVEIVVFPRDYEKYHAYLTEDAKIFVRGHANVEEEKNGKLICEKIYGFDDSKKELWLQFANLKEYEEKEKELFPLLDDSDGNDEVIIYIAQEKRMKRLARSHSVKADDRLVNVLTNFLGEGNVKVVEKNVENP